MALVTNAQARGHLRLPDAAAVPPNADDTDLTLKLAQAEAIILDYLNATAYWRTITPTWTNETNVPKQVHAAILLQLGELWRFRGDDLHDEGPQHEPGTDLSPAIVSLLRRTRDPVIV